MKSNRARKRLRERERERQRNIVIRRGRKKETTRDNSKTKEHTPWSFKANPDSPKSATTETQHGLRDTKPLPNILDIRAYLCHIHVCIYQACIEYLKTPFHSYTYVWDLA